MIVGFWNWGSNSFVYLLLVLILEDFMEKDCKLGYINSKINDVFLVFVFICYYFILVFFDLFVSYLIVF